MGKLIFNAQSTPVAPVGENKHTMFVDNADGKLKMEDSNGNVCGFGDVSSNDMYFGNGTACCIFDTDCTILAKTYEVDKFIVCEGVTLRFCGGGIPVIRAKTFCNMGTIDMYYPSIEDYQKVIQGLPEIFQNQSPICYSIPVFNECGGNGGAYGTSAKGGKGGCNGCCGYPGTGNSSGVGGCPAECAGGGGGGSDTCSGAAVTSGSNATPCCGGNGGNAKCVGGGGGGGYGLCLGGNGGYGGELGGTGGDGGNSMCGNGGCGGCSLDTGSNGGNGGNSMYGNGGCGGGWKGIYGGCGGKGGDSIYGNGGDGGSPYYDYACGCGGKGGMSIFGTGGNGGCGCFGCFHGGDGGNGRNGGNGGCGTGNYCPGGNGGNAIGGNYSIGIIANNYYNNCILSCGGNGGNAGTGSCINSCSAKGGNGSNGGNVYIYVKNILNEGCVNICKGLGGSGGTYPACKGLDGCNGLYCIINTPFLTEQTLNDGFVSTSISGTNSAHRYTAPMNGIVTFCGGSSNCGGVCLVTNRGTHIQQNYSGSYMGSVIGVKKGDWMYLACPPLVAGSGVFYGI